MEPEIIKYSSNYHSFRFDSKKKSVYSQKFFICSDVHYDNPKCDRKTFHEHMDNALAENAFIIITGDLFCLMQGKYDPRRAKSGVRSEHNEDNYLDLVINDTANKFKKYAKNLLLVTRGNHETSVSQKCETDVMERFVERLNMLAGSNVQIGTYTGYYTLSFSYKKGSKKTINVGYSHGNWGGIITKGTLGVVRYAAIMPDADLIFSGHTHDSWIVTQPRYIMDSRRKKVSVKNQWHVKTGTYKEEYADGKGWAVERIGMPKSIGGCFMEVKYKQKEDLIFPLTLTS